MDSSCGFEQFVLVDQATKGVGHNLCSGKHALLDADAIEQRQRERLDVDLLPDLVDGFGQFLRSDLSTLAFVGTGLVFHDGDTVLFVAEYQVWMARQVERRGWPSSSVKVSWLTARIRATMVLPSAMSMAPRTRILR